MSPWNCIVRIDKVRNESIHEGGKKRTKMKSNSEPIQRCKFQIRESFHSLQPDDAERCAVYISRFQVNLFKLSFWISSINSNAKFDVLTSYWIPYTQIKSQYIPIIPSTQTHTRFVTYYSLSSLIQLHSRTYSRAAS